MKTFFNIAAFGFLFYALLWIVAIIGYVRNLIKLCQCDFSSATSWKAEVIHGIGVFGPGAILGWFDFGV